MIRRIYRIQMHTPLGSRPGTMEVLIEKNTVRGYLDILRHLEPFEGSIDENGRCRIRGILVTLLSRIPYTATGRITPDVLDLSLRGGQNRFPVRGTVCREEPDRPPFIQQ
ncbi:MAG: hypothetical protein ACI4LH_05445 [Candidatus Heritagella sp.]